RRLRPRDGGGAATSRRSGAVTHPQRAHEAHGGPRLWGGVSIRPRVPGRVRAARVPAGGAAGPEMVRAERHGLRKDYRRADGVLEAVEGSMVAGCGKRDAGGVKCTNASRISHPASRL